MSALISKPGDVVGPAFLPVTRTFLSAPPSRKHAGISKPRHSFDVYEDQVEALQQLALEDRMRGGSGSMSAMAREALDDYIAKVRA